MLDANKRFFYVTNSLLQQSEKHPIIEPMRNNRLYLGIIKKTDDEVQIFETIVTITNKLILRYC